MFALQSTLDYICCQIIISGKTFLMLKNENLCINGRKWCFDIIWLYSASHVYIRRPTFGHGVYIQNHRLNTISFSTWNDGMKCQVEWNMNVMKYSMNREVKVTRGKKTLPDPE